MAKTFEKHYTVRSDYYDTTYTNKADAIALAEIKVRNGEEHAVTVYEAITRVALPEQEKQPVKNTKREAVVTQIN